MAPCTDGVIKEVIKVLGKHSENNIYWKSIQNFFLTLYVMEAFRFMVYVRTKPKRIYTIQAKENGSYLASRLDPFFLTSIVYILLWLMFYIQNMTIDSSICMFISMFHLFHPSLCILASYTYRGVWLVSYRAYIWSDEVKSFSHFIFILLLG